MGCEIVYGTFDLTAEVFEVFAQYDTFNSWQSPYARRRSDDSVAEGILDAREVEEAGGCEALKKILNGYGISLMADPKNPQRLVLSPNATKKPVEKSNSVASTARATPENWLAKGPITNRAWAEPIGQERFLLLGIDPQSGEWTIEQKGSELSAVCPWPQDEKTLDNGVAVAHEGKVIVKMVNNPSAKFSEDSTQPDQPVVGISSFHAVAWCLLKNLKSGSKVKYDLPTFEEFYAAQGQTHLEHVQQYDFWLKVNFTSGGPCGGTCHVDFKLFEGFDSFKVAVMDWDPISLGFHLAEFVDSTFPAENISFIPIVR